jgi:hypothetical protein
MATAYAEFEPELGGDVPSYLKSGRRYMREEEIVRRAYEISLSSEGGTPEMNRARAEAEMRSQLGPYP